MKTILVRLRKPFYVLLLFAFLLRVTQGAEINVFALQGPGQATVVIDDKAHVAHLIDLGKSGDGDRLELNGKPIIAALREMGVNRITITCSHPHADHHGGFKKMLAMLSNFSDNGTKYFGDTIPIIESAMPQANSLASILRKTVVGTGIKVEVRPSLGKDTYRGFSSPDSEVFVETIPYESSEKAGVHGRAVITKVTLAKRYVHVDFDDADSNAIRQVAMRLKDEGAKVDSFIVPHHGSAEHDIDPILDLKPETGMTAIISVDPLNRYGHPSPEILLKLLKSLPREKVVLTGAGEGERVVITPEGVTHAPYTAASYDTFALFVLPSMVRAKGKRAADMKDAYHEIWRIISGGESEPPTPPSPDSVRATPRPPQPSSDGSVAVADQIALNGTMLGEAFDAGTAQFGFITASHAQQHKVFAQANPSPSANRIQALYASLSTDDKLAVLRRLNQMVKSVDPRSKLLVSYLTDYGVPDVLRAAELKPVPLASAPVRSDTLAKHDNGGMVDLKGDKVFMGPNAQILVGGVVRKCPSGLCLVTNSALTGRATSFRLPFTESILAAAVWDRTSQRGLDQLYLSIDPTSRLLKDPSAKVPSDKLHFGAALPADWQNNRVVTHGDVDKSVIGKILWEADVAFKSESLGFNVLTGVRPSAEVPRDISVDEDPSALGFAARLTVPIPRVARWCRMFWESGEQKLVADTVNGRILLDGKAVVARGEAMKLTAGRLTEYPAGDWCEESKQVARTLEAHANSPAATGTLKQLRDLAEMQNFWRWAREHLITTNDEVKRDFERLLAQDDGENIPVFTSGVKSTEPVLTQYQRKIGYKESQLLHVRYADEDTMERCVLPQWEQVQANLEAAGIRPDKSGTFKGAQVFTVVDKEMRQFSIEVAHCAHGINLPAKLDRISRITDDDDPESGVFGVAPHRQPIEIHGGILLGKSSKVLRDVVQETGFLDDLAGRPLFRQEGKNLHFWSVSNPGKINEIAEHLEVRDASLVEAYPAAGAINFLIRSSSDSLLRHELRQKQSPVLGRGLEWMGVYSSPGEPAYWQKAAWPCTAEATGCSWVTDVSSTQLDQYLIESPDDAAPDRLISYATGDDSLWVVRLDIGTTVDSLLSLASGDRANDPDVLASVARSLAWWGFGSEAEAMAERSQDLDRRVSDAEDYTAAFLAPDMRSRQMAVLFLRLLLIDREALLGESTTAETALDALATYERKLKRLPVAGSAGIWRGMLDICNKIETSQISAAVKNRLESAAARYAVAARVAELMEQ